MNKPIHVVFADEKIEKEFESLKKGKFPELQLYDFIEKTINKLKINPVYGIKIPRRLWPKSYISYKLTNLWKCNLPNGWRLIYTIKENEVMVLNVILEWFDHNGYERRFGY